ncbi:MAG: RDD family protein, partial [Actinomycetota bacterium]|nr:RDD family protein [Actinomycetota bacterium]
MTQPPALPPEGWYPNPENTEQQRWWDGKQWTEHVAVGAPMAPGYQQQPYQPTQQPYQAGTPAQPGYQPYPGQPGGPGYPQYAGYAPAPPRGVLPDGALVAGWWWRVLARVIDGFVTGIPTLLFAVPIFTRFIDRFRNYIDEVDAANRAGTPVPDFNMGSFTRDFVIIALIGGLVTIVYEVVMLKLCSATVGKLACGLRVRAWDSRGPL